MSRLAALPAIKSASFRALPQMSAQPLAVTKIQPLCWDAAVANNGRAVWQHGACAFSELNASARVGILCSVRKPVVQYL